MSGQCVLQIQERGGLCSLRIYKENASVFIPAGGGGQEQNYHIHRLAHHGMVITPYAAQELFDDVVGFMGTPYGVPPSQVHASQAKELFLLLVIKGAQVFGAVVCPANLRPGGYAWHSRSESHHVVEWASLAEKVSKSPGTKKMAEKIWEEKAMALSKPLLGYR